MGFNSNIDNRKIIYIGELIYRAFSMQNNLIDCLNEIKNLSIQDAYMVQNYFLSKIEKNNKKNLIGWKLGLTSNQLQKKFNTKGPCFGQIHKNNIFYSPKILNLSSLVRIGIENEVAIRLREDIPSKNELYTSKDIIKYIKSFHSAIEIVDDQGVNSQDIDIGFLISMNVFNRYIVLGKEKPINEINDLRNLKTRLIHNHKLIENGNTNNVMGNPINSLVWLANNVSISGNKLKKDDIIITGTTLDPKWIKSNGIIESVIENLGVSILEIE